MKIRVLGAHNCESRDTRLVSLLVDGILALDAGAITSGLSLADQQKIQAILLTHQHYDHIRDVPSVAMNLYLARASTSIYSTTAVYDALTTHLLNGEIYSDFFHRPEEKPTLGFIPLEPGKSVRIGSYTVMAVPVVHSVPTLGFQITSNDGKSVFYTGDTGPGLSECWQMVSPQMLIIEVTASDRYQDFGRESNHLTPGLLREELMSFRKIRGYLPQVVAVHMSPELEAEIRGEITVVSQDLAVPITIAYEGLELDL